jgi:hypothetical protein
MMEFLQPTLQVGRQMNATDLVMRQTGSREDGNLLTTSNGVYGGILLVTVHDPKVETVRTHGVNRRNTSLNHLFRVDTRIRIDGRSCGIGTSASPHS